MRLILRRLSRLCRSLHTGWSILGLTLVLIVLAELGLRGVFWLKDRGRPVIPPDPRVLAAIEGSAEWLPTHYRELERLSNRWEPYVYFRQRPFQGRTISIDAEGLRATWTPPRSSSPDTGEAAPLRLLLLGGSSLWGYGGRDDQTIPSHIARALHARGMAFETRNLAEIGYVNTQEMVALVRELQSGYRPDLVLFYDGVNDTTSALLERQAAVTTNEINRIREFNLRQSPARLMAALTASLVRDSGWYRFAASIGRRLAKPPARDPRSLESDSLRPLARDVIGRYEANVRLIKALGREYDFRPLFVWQPVIFDKPSRVPFEEEEREKYGWTREMFGHVREELAKCNALMSDPDFSDLGDIFQGEGSLVFLDYCHTTEAANETIAKRIVERLLPILEEIKAGRASPRQR